MRRSGTASPTSGAGSIFNWGSSIFVAGTSASVVLSMSHAVVTALVSQGHAGLTFGDWASGSTVVDRRAGLHRRQVLIETVPASKSGLGTFMTEPAVERQFLGVVEVDSGTLVISDPAYCLPHRDRDKPGVSSRKAS